MACPLLALAQRPVSRSACALALLAFVPGTLPEGTRVNAPVVTGGYFGIYQVSADGSRVFHAGYQTTVGKAELHDTPLDGSQATRVLSAPLLPGRSLQTSVPFKLQPDQSHALYVADQDTDEKYELYGVPTDGSRVSTKLSAPMIAAGDIQLDYRWTPDGARYLYRADSVIDSIMYLYSGPADGSVPPVQLHPTHVFAFEVTPDSSRVVLETSQLWSVPADGSAPSQQLTNLQYVDKPRITADGQRVVFEGGYWYYDPLTEEDLARGLYSVPVTGGPAAVLVPPSEITFSLSTPPVFELTPDSVRAVYHRRVDGQLFSALTDGSALREHINDLPFVNQVTTFRITPDASKVLFAAQGNGGYALYRVPIDGSAAPVALTSVFTSHVIEHVSVTASGHVLYVRRPFTGSGSELYRVPLDGSSAPELLSDPAPAGGIGNPDFTSATPAWFSPDQRFVVFLAWKDAAKKAEVFCTEVDGSGPVRKVSAEIVTGGDAFSLQFIPGGRRLVYAADQETNNLSNLYMSDYGSPPGRWRPPHAPRAAPLVRLGPPSGVARTDSHEPSQRTWP